MNQLKRFWLILAVIPNLGYYNFVYAVFYKIRMKLGLLTGLFPIRQYEYQVHFNPSTPVSNFKSIWKEGLLVQANNILNGKFTWFAYHNFDIGELPDWFSNPFSKKVLENPSLHWTKISDFNSEIGDIKVIWELSRFDWLTILARAHKVTGEVRFLNRLNNLLNSWMVNNPPNQGPNWMCGQETSVRLMKIITTSTLLEVEDKSRLGLLQLVASHVDRINSNITYGVVQDNNHGTSESAGLYIGSSWLIKNNFKIEKYIKLKNKGRDILEKCIFKLIQPDGSFSQRSCNYHRVVMDTFSFVLHVMNELKEPPFSIEIVERLTKLGEWQYKMTFGKSGQAPNYGNNDGALFENLHSINYEDFRVSTQLFFALLIKKRVYNLDEISEPVYWRSRTPIHQLPLHNINNLPLEIFDDHTAILKNDKAKVFVKLPDDIFRPGNDGFHIDLWVDGVNVLIDSGSYSYNSEGLTDIFNGVRAHNTVNFGDHEQMPRLSRFLNGSWIKLDDRLITFQDSENISLEGFYTDYKRNQHFRKVVLQERKLSVHDSVQSNERAQANFHFPLTTNNINLSTTGALEQNTFEFSKFYLFKEKGIVKTVKFENSCVTEISW